MSTTGKVLGERINISLRGHHAVIGRTKNPKMYGTTAENEFRTARTSKQE